MDYTRDHETMEPQELHKCKQACFTNSTKSLSCMWKLMSNLVIFQNSVNALFQELIKLVDLKDTHEVLLMFVIKIEIKGLHDAQIIFVTLIRLHHFSLCQSK